MKINDFSHFLILLSLKKKKNYSEEINIFQIYFVCVLFFGKYYYNKLYSLNDNNLRIKIANQIISNQKPSNKSKYYHFLKIIRYLLILK